MKKVIATLLFAVLTVDSSAQETHSANRFEVEIDPIAYLLQGYSLHGVYVYDRIRTDLGVFGITQPEGYGGNDGFQVKTQGLGVKVNYLLDENERWFAGIGMGYSNNRITLQGTNETHNQNVFGVGIHAGYRWFVTENEVSAFRNLYLAPWCSVDYNHTVNDVSFTAKKYKQHPVSFFPTVHIGYRF